MDTWLIVVLAAVAVLLLLAVGGAVATARRAREKDPQLFEAVGAVNDALAAAHVEDKGWDPARLHEAAAAAFSERQPGVEPESLTLVFVDDRPGIEHDRAVFKVLAADDEHELVLGRAGDSWVTVET